jgi:hypothetical protein
MAVNSSSRHFLCTGVTRVNDGLTFLFDREPVYFQPRKDNRRIVARSGDTWYSLAAEYFPSTPEGEQLFWVICDYQPVPVLDATVDPEPGTVIYVPAEDFVSATYFADSRRDQNII